MSQKQSYKNHPQRAFQLEENEDGLVFGEGDTKKEHPFPKGWMGRVVVRQSVLERMGSGTVQEDRGSVKVMNYETEVFNKLEKEEFFVFPAKVQILHDPR